MKGLKRVCLSMLLTVLLMSGAGVGMAAVTGSPAGPGNAPSVGTETATQSEDSNDAMFWVVLLVVILFIVGSASAMRFFGPRQPGDEERKGPPE